MSRTIVRMDYGAEKESRISRRERRRAARWARRQARLDRRHPPRHSRLGEAGTCPGTTTDVGCIESDWTAPPAVNLADGTSIRLLKDGQGLTAALAAIKIARESIRLEPYIFHSDETGRTFADALAQRALHGVRVFVIYDSFGCIDSDPSMFHQMRKAGVHLAEFHPLRPWDSTHSWRPFNRDHRKLLVVDNQFAGMGGLNIGSEYGSGFLVPLARRCELWRDNAIAIAGPGAKILADCFDRSWQYCRNGGPIRRAQLDHVNLGQSIRVSGIGEHLPQHGRRIRSQKSNTHGPLNTPQLVYDFGVLASVPVVGSPLVPFLRNLVRQARYSLDMTVAYFAPSDLLINELLQAARRGVQVRLMLPGRSDVKILRYAAHSFYELLLDAGVEVWERQGAILHAKTMVIDEEITLFGSANLDYRSIEFNCELSAVIRSRDFGRQMTCLFQHDAGFAEKIDVNTWRSRPWRDRIVQWAASRARYLL